MNARLRLYRVDMGDEPVDVVVVGGRCAGATTAMLLARAGLRVRLLERARRVGDIVSGHMIKPPGVDRLRAWGLLDDLVATTPEIFNRTYWLDDEPHSAPPLPGGRHALAPRRTVLDPLLLDAARQSGVDVRLGTSVTGVRMAGQRVVGVDTNVGEHRARLVIGADGRHSTIARAVHAEYTWFRPAATYAYYTYWSGSGIDGVHVVLYSGMVVGLFPTNDGQVQMFYQAPVAGLGTARRAADERYHRVHERDTVRRLLGDAKITERLRGSGDLPSFFRRSAGPGWVLVGDAGHHKDPLIARGITDAFRDADLVAEIVTAHWDDDLDAGLAEYPRHRDRAAMPLAEANHTLAELNWPTDVFAQHWLAAGALEEQIDRQPIVLAG